MTESSRLRDWQLGVKTRLSRRRAHRTLTRRRTGAITAWTRWEPSPHFLRQKSRFGRSRMMLVCADM